MPDQSPPPLEYEHRPCDVCGAATDGEAARRCVQNGDETGERYCRGGAEEESYPDGRLRFATQASIDRLGAYYDALVDAAERDGPTEG